MSELMAMLTSGAPGFDTIRSTNGNSITATDVASCLVKLDRITYLYALEKFALDGACRTELRELAIIDGFKAGFKLKEGETNKTIAILSLMALEIAINPINCKKCKGVGEIKLDSRVVQCESCKGAGQRPISERNLAKMLSVTRFQARKVWEKRLNLLLSRYLERDEWIRISILSGLKDHSV